MSMSSPALPLSGRVAIVTGANHGIGASTARRLAELGADVLVTYLRNTNPASGDVPSEYTAQRASDANAGYAAASSDQFTGITSDCTTSVESSVPSADSPAEVPMVPTPRSSELLALRPPSTAIPTSP